MGNGAVAERHVFGEFIGWLVTSIPFGEHLHNAARAGWGFMHHMLSMVTGAIPFLRGEAEPVAEAPAADEPGPLATSRKSRKNGLAHSPPSFFHGVGRYTYDTLGLTPSTTPFWNVRLHVLRPNSGEALASGEPEPVAEAPGSDQPGPVDEAPDSDEPGRLAESRENGLARTTRATGNLNGMVEGGSDAASYSVGSFSYTNAITIDPEDQSGGTQGTSIS
jgi:hypothetical protein